MKFIVICVVLLFASQRAFAAAAADAPSPVAFNFSPGAQSSNPDQTVVGFRGNFFYGENKNMFGADLGIFVNNTREVFGGVAIAGLANITGTQAYIAGLQFAGLTNFNRGKAIVVGFQIAGLLNSIGDAGSIYGVQLAALANLAAKTDIHGLQLGLYNKAQRVVGLQVGLLNFADSLHGIQLGLLNFCNHGGILPVFPVLNIGL